MDGVQPDIKKWIVFYPIYINSKKTIAQGRRISAAKACENPTCIEIGDCCNYLKLPFAIELDKAYPRDFMQRGRVRVLLKREDGSLYNPAISSNNMAETFGESDDALMNMSSSDEEHSTASQPPGENFQPVISKRQLGQRARRERERLERIISSSNYGATLTTLSEVNMIVPPIERSISGKQLMVQVAELVPKHHGRNKKQEVASASTAGGSSKSGKGGKKKK